MSLCKGICRGFLLIILSKLFLNKSFLLRTYMIKIHKLEKILIKVLFEQKLIRYDIVKIFSDQLIFFIRIKRKTIFKLQFTLGICILIMVPNNWIELIFPYTFKFFIGNNI